MESIPKIQIYVNINFISLQVGLTGKGENGQKRLCKVVRGVL